MSTDFKDSFELFTTELMGGAEVQLRKNDCAYKEQFHHFYGILEHLEEVASAENITIVDQQLKDDLKDFKDLYVDPLPIKPIPPSTCKAIAMPISCSAWWASCSKTNQP